MTRFRTWCDADPGRMSYFTYGLWLAALTLYLLLAW